jgi:hypothetical protein
MPPSHSIMWVYPDDHVTRGKINDVAVRADGGISIDCMEAGDFYLVRLDPVPGTSQMNGEFRLGKSNPEGRGNVVATRYENSDAIALTSEWVQDGEVYSWVAEIRKILIRK